MRLSGLFIIAIASALANAAPAAAADVTADIDVVAQLMKKGGYTVEIKGEKGDRYIRSSRGKDSYGFSVTFYGCAEGTMRDCKSVQFYAGFTPKARLTLEALNDYARENRWGRIYRDKEGDPVIEMDVDLEKGGMSEALFLDNLEYFEAVMDRFGAFVFDQEPKA